MSGCGLQGSVSSAGFPWLTPESGTAKGRNLKEHDESLLCHVARTHLHLVYIPKGIAAAPEVYLFVASSCVCIVEDMHPADKSLWGA